MVKDYECANEYGAIRHDDASLATCVSTCDSASNGKSGCCEFQEDWKACIFVPGAKAAMPSVPNSGGRHAADCIFDGVYKICIQYYKYKWFQNPILNVSF